MAISFEAEACIDTTYYRPVNILEDKDYYNQSNIFIPPASMIISMPAWSEDILDNSYVKIVKMS